MSVTPSLPAPHAAFLAAAIPRLAADARLIGVAAGRHEAAVPTLRRRAEAEAAAVAYVDALVAGRGER